MTRENQNRRDDDDSDPLASFLRGDSDSSGNAKKRTTVSDAAKRSEDPLLGALSLVLAANHDYAKSVSSLLSTDLSQGQSLAEIKERMGSLTEKTEYLITCQEELLELLKSLPTSHKEAIEILIKAQEQRNVHYFDERFGILFERFGLKRTGETYGEADGLIRKIKYLASKQVMTVVVGMMIYNIALWIIEHANKLAIK